MEIKTKNIKKILLKEKKYSLKEKVSWIVFAINPNIYYKIVK